jgi:hypothetical protein
MHSPTLDALWTAGLLSCFIPDSHWVGPGGGVIALEERKCQPVPSGKRITVPHCYQARNLCRNSSRLGKVECRVDGNGVARHT